MPLNSDRGGELFVDGSSGYYLGAGTDLMLTRDTWGMLDRVGILGEIGVKYKRWSSNTVATSDTTGVTRVSSGGLSKVQVTMLTVDVAPKVKFRQGTDFQPWIIPVGLDFHVISPPSNQTNHLDIAVQFGAGVEFRMWKELWLGVDGRYHLASGVTNNVTLLGREHDLILEQLAMIETTIGPRTLPVMSAIVPIANGIMRCMNACVPIFITTSCVLVCRHR